MLDPGLPPPLQHFVGTPVGELLNMQLHDIEGSPRLFRMLYGGALRRLSGTRDGVKAPGFGPARPHGVSASVEIPLGAGIDLMDGDVTSTRKVEEVINRRMNEVEVEQRRDALGRRSYNPEDHLKASDIRKRTLFADILPGAGRSSVNWLALRNKICRWLGVLFVPVRIVYEAVRFLGSLLHAAWEWVEPRLSLLPGVSAGVGAVDSAVTTAGGAFERYVGKPVRTFSRDIGILRPLQIMWRTPEHIWHYIFPPLDMSYERPEAKALRMVW